MGLTVPNSLISILSEVDSTDSPIDEMRLAGRLSAALGEKPELSLDERKGAFAEIEALRFQRTNGAESRTWGIYWNELASGTTGDGQPFYTPDIAFVDEDVLAHWINRSEQACHPAIRARFSDLAWEIGRFLSRKPKPGENSARPAISIPISHQLAQRAVDGYLEILSRALIEDEYHAWQFLDRALELASSMNDTARCAKVKAALFAYQQSIASTNPAYMIWRFDEIAWSRSAALSLTDAEKQMLIDVLERGLTIRSSSTDKTHFDPHAAMDIAGRLRRRRVQRGEHDEAKRAIKTAGAAFEEVAKEADALLASAWLEDLIPRYRNEGMTDDVARVDAAIRSRADEAAGQMKRIEVPVSIPKEELDKWADQVAGSTPEEAFRGLAAAALIREESTKKSVQATLANAPLLAHMSSSIMGTDGFTTAKVGSIYDDLDGRTIQHAADLINWQAPWLNVALNRAKEKHSFDVNQILIWLRGCPYFAASREPLLRVGLEAWASEQPIEAIHILVPQIEAALRDILASLGGATHYPDPNIGGFKVVGMGEILNHAAFKGRVPNDIRFHFRVLYSDPRGINLRNHLAHGLAHPSLLNMGLANWVLHSLLLIGVLRPVAPFDGRPNPQSHT